MGTFSFEARLTNTSDRSLSDLVVVVTTLTNGNLLQNADGGPGGVGARLTVPRQDGFSRWRAQPRRIRGRALYHLLNERRALQFVVDVLGDVDASPDAQARAPLVREGKRAWAQPPE